MTVRIGSPEEIDAAAEATSAPENVAYQHGEPGAFVDQDGNPYDPETINRNAPCPCGSGEKFKFCHGRVL
jgi:preprotein translocase subunit SecA